MKFRPSLASALVACGALLGFSATARAHFYLMTPPASATQNMDGDPQKIKPCGGGATNTTITTVKAGEMLSVSWRETTYHPGHFRISLSANTADFVDPVVTGANCGAAAIANPPMMPVLADGVNAKTTRTNLMFETKVKIPDNFTCEKCTLQVIQFMSQHGAPCFYYHCATLKVTAAGTGGAGGSGGMDGGVPDSSGSGGSGGAGGSGGTGGSTGGTGGTGGSTGGSGGSTGGTGGSGGASAGGSSGTGGTGGSSGGSTGGSGTGGSGSGGRGGSSGSGSGGSGSPPSGGGSSGGCSVGGDQPSLAAIGFVAMFLGLAFRVRRRTRR